MITLATSPRAQRVRRRCPSPVARETTTPAASGAPGRGNSGGGIDGIIKEDRLGLDVVYVQAKKWAGTVGRPEIQKFAGALQGQRARKGVFITTSNFSSDARQFVASIDVSVRRTTS